MKNRIQSLSTIVVLFILVFAGCTKDEPEPEEPSTTTTGSPTGSFKYTPNGGAELTADSARYITAFNNIVAYKGNTTIDIVLSSLSTGNYTLSQGNTLDYYNGHTNYSSVNGIVNITANTGSNLSGSFTASLSGGSVSSLSGQFSEIKRR